MLRSKITNHERRFEGDPDTPDHFALIVEWFDPLLVRRFFLFCEDDYSILCVFAAASCGLCIRTRAGRVPVEARFLRVPRYWKSSLAWSRPSAARSNYVRPRGTIRPANHSVLPVPGQKCSYGCECSIKFWTWKTPATAEVKEQKTFSFNFFALCQRLCWSHPGLFAAVKTMVATIWIHRLSDHDPLTSSLVS